MKPWMAVLVVAGLWSGLVWGASDGPTREEVDALKKEIANLKGKVGTAAPSGTAARVESAVENKYGPNAIVTTKAGKLVIGGLVQVWYYTIQNDHHNWVASNALGGGQFGSNETSDNDTFRVRRARVWFDLDIHENVSARIMLNPANEPTSFPPMPNNQGNFTNAGYGAGGAPIGSTRNVAVQDGAGAVPRLLEEAWINYHGVIPHHDVTVGEMFRKLGEEGPRPSAQLDFIERAMITQFPAAFTDQGLQVHGTWFDDRFQYWLGAFNHAASAFQLPWNRADDNDDKDGLATLQVRPLWKDETWGSLEMGYSIQCGMGGEAGGHRPGTNPVDGLNFPRTFHSNQYAWACYRPGGPAKGWWLRGEWGQYRDRFRPNDVISCVALLGRVRNPAPFTIHGWYVATGF